MTTQIIINATLSAQTAAQRTAKEISNINEYKRKWKIKTNKDKFAVIPISRKKRREIIAGEKYNYEK